MVESIGLWTIQSSDAWANLQAKGTLLCNFESEMAKDCTGAYRWIIHQMKLRVGNPPKGARYPIWAWYQWNGAKRARPDLRARGHVNKGEEAVLLELKVPRNLVLLSDFDPWHIVLNEANPSSFKKKWEGIFDINSRRGFSRSHLKTRAIQATLWELKLDYVLSYKRFKGR